VWLFCVTTAKPSQSYAGAIHVPSTVLPKSFKPFKVSEQARQTKKPDRRGKAGKQMPWPKEMPQQRNRTIAKQAGRVDTKEMS
jgi:hypothetical protein